MKFNPKKYPEGDLNPFTYTAIVLILAFCLYGYHAGNDTRKMEATNAVMMAGVSAPARAEVTAPYLPDGVGVLMGSRKVFVGPQLNAEQLTRFLASFQIDHVIDLAHEADAEKVLSQQAERFIVENTGATYWPLNIEGSNNRLNQQVLGVIDSLVDSGRPVFVHCLHGIHRVGVVKGRAYARDLRRWDEIVALLGWEAVVDNPKYDRYTNDVWEHRFNAKAQPAR